MFIKIDNINDSKESVNNLNFTIEGDFDYGLDKSVINAIRRTIIEDIPTVAFNFDETVEEKDIIINTNNTSLHNEMILHRLSLLTLYIDPEDSFKYLFKLNKKHETGDPYKFVDSNDLDIYKILPDKKDLDKMDDKNYEAQPITQSEKDKLLRPFTFRDTKNYSLLIELKNSHTGIVNQELNLYASPSINTGKYNANYQSCSRVSYSFVIDEELVKLKLGESIKANDVSEDDKKDHAHKFILEYSERYFHRDSQDEAYKYNIDIESQHYYDSVQIFNKSLEILIQKLSYLKEQFVYLMKDEPSSISIEKTKSSVYTYTLNDENHTIGNLLQSHIVRHSIDDTSVINGCCYKKLHPLEESIVLILSVNPSNKIYKKSETQIIQQLTEFVRSQLDEIKNNIIDISKASAKAF